MVFVTVLLTLSSAALLNYAAKQMAFGVSLTLAIIIAVVGINVLKLKLWGDIYQRYHLHESYPLTAVFFPLIYLYAVLIGEGTFQWHKTIGAFLIVTGIAVMSYNRSAGR